jgi:hypothetical protein
VTAGAATWRTSVSRAIAETHKSNTRGRCKVGGADATQLDQSRGSRRAVDVRGYTDGPRLVRHAARRNSWSAGRRAPSGGSIRRQYSRLGLPEHKSGQLSRHHDSGCYLVDALDDSRCQGAVLLGNPWIEVGVRNTSYNQSIYNPALFGQLAWNLGNGFGFSYALGAYVGIGEPVAWSSTSLNQRFALSYVRDGWNLTANVIYGLQFDSFTNEPQISPCPAPFGLSGCNPDFLNIDLTATKKLGKWEVGMVAYASTDLTRPIGNYQKQGYIAVGALLGYDFGPVNLQAYATTEVVAGSDRLERAVLRSNRSGLGLEGCSAPA